ncbi:class I SAM-dependent methyltransferase [Paenibacillus aestuarii]|uniref:Class I SAM-dependent methyltransferase n=1 Tax=Paenibacillus aestuarii TaxID=516965 RepID=A0ABW0KK42_9BACL|nr:class I SAM-dependent methyltransferase [Paenibacillus aestuarii]
MEDTQVKSILKTSYDQQAQQRNQSEVQSWKITEMQKFLAHLKPAAAVVDLGSGPGHQAEYLQQHGCDVTCVDLSEEMVRICRQKGLRAEAMDFYALAFVPESFDAVWTMNALLHVPKASLRQVLEQIERVLKPDGLLYLGLYGGYESEGIWEEDNYRPQRFFAFYEDAHIQRLVAEVFDMEQFTIVTMEDGMKLHYQSIIARKKQVRS